MVLINFTSETYEKDNFYFGAIGGYSLDYDLRLNTIIKDFVYNEDTHILCIMPYLLNKYSNYDLSSIIKSSNYYVIWTAPPEHEIGVFQTYLLFFMHLMIFELWNNANMHCDLLLKVNTLEVRNEF